MYVESAACLTDGYDITAECVQTVGCDSRARASGQPVRDIVPFPFIFTEAAVACAGNVARCLGFYLFD